MQAASAAHATRSRSTPKRLPVDLASPLKAAFGQEGASVGAAVSQGGATAAEIARQGLQGPGDRVPGKEDQERSFGADFSGVRVFQGGAAGAANQALGSKAFAMGSDLAFGQGGTPAASLVAHELTHVLQQSGGGQPQRAALSGGVDTSGEREATAVEHAVESGRPARSALSAGTAAVGASSPGATGAAPALAGNPFTMSFTFSREQAEKTNEYKIWDKGGSFPTPVPGINFVLKPSVKVIFGKVGVGYGGDKKGQVSVTPVGVKGSLGVGLSGGVANVAELYATLNPEVTGAGTFKAGPGNQFSLDVGIKVGVAGKIGVKLGPGLFDVAYKFMDLELLKLTGIYFDQKGFHGEKFGAHVGKDIETILAAVNEAIQMAKSAGAAAWEGARSAAGFVADTAEGFWDAVTSW